MGRKEATEKKDKHPLHMEIECVAKAYNRLFDAACRKYQDKNLIASTVLGIHVSVGGMLMNNITDLMCKNLEKKK